MEKKLAILMADLSGYTALTEIHGAAKAAYIIHKYQDIVNNSLVGESFLLESVGDQVVIVSSNPDDLAKTALLLQMNASQITHFLPIHAGIHYGSVLELSGHYYGSAVNLTARIAARAQEGKILSSIDFVNALSSAQIFPYNSFGYVRFKNIRDKVEIVELIQEQVNAIMPLDPICYMQLDKSDRQHFSQYNDTTYYFCSDNCQNIFEKIKDN